jgi:integrase/recombinase XerD
MCALEAGVPLREVQIAARHADPRTTTVYDQPRKLHQTRAKAQVGWS